jgi:ABC-2 type transport system permease protein
MVAKRLIKQIGADKRSLGLMFFAPVLIIYLLHIILTSGTSQPAIDVVNAPDTFVEKLKEHADVRIADSEGEAMADIKEKEADAYLLFEGTAPKLTVEGSDPNVTKLVIFAVQQTLQGMVPEQMKQNMGNPLPQKPEIDYVYGGEAFDLFDAFAPLFMGFFIFFFVFIISGISFLRERISGTLDRILATPLRRWEIVLGYFLGFGLFVAIQTVIIQLFSVYGLDVEMAGSFWELLLLNLILATVALSLGTFLSAYARNEFQLFQFIPVVIVPQFLFSGIFDLAEAPNWVKALSQVFPLTYAAEALRDVMIRGYHLDDVRLHICVLLGFALFFLMLNTLALKKYRKT